MPQREIPGYGSHTDTANAAAVLIDVYMELARAEALTRALTNERGGRHDCADFWVRVFLGIPSIPGPSIDEQK